MGQAALWTLAHFHDANWETVVPETHDSLEAVRRLLACNPASLARFLVRCGQDDEQISAQLARVNVNLAPVLRTARDELAAMAEHEHG